MALKKYRISKKQRIEKLQKQTEQDQRQEEDDVSSESEKENEDTEIEEAVNLDDHCTETTSTKRKKLWSMLSFKDSYRIYFLSSSVAIKTAEHLFFRAEQVVNYDVSDGINSDEGHHLLLIFCERRKRISMLPSDQRIYRILTRSTTL
ncbi:unnamed protein product [Caenorhabditis sp. 36 PRJEB53466]|nr:unnamed protein product [Caenorhabditis sp. 36 PRJEB53466]